ncbi:transposable element Tcb1 transposase [Trichonephila clavipes]|nr:transposable element Tcb1 transposase [Trichonephila clavipes]
MDHSVTSRTVAEHIESITQHSVFASTIRRRLQQSGLFARCPLLGLQLTQNKSRLCHKWCDERRVWEAEWNEVDFSNESRICLQLHDGRIWSLETPWREDAEQLRYAPPHWSGTGRLALRMFRRWKTDVHGCSTIDPVYTSQLPHQINFGNAWKLLVQLYPKNTSRVSLNQCRGVWQR